MNWISFCFMILITSLTGSLVFCVWKLCSLWLGKEDAAGANCLGLAVSLAFFIVPASYVYLLLATGCFSDGTASELFMGTPFLVELSRILIFIWAAGIAVRLIRIGRKRIRFSRLLKKIPEAEPYVQGMADSLRRKLKIRRKVSVCQLPGYGSPSIVNKGRILILLPEKEYEDKNLYYVLKHELFHYKHGDLFLKSVFFWIRVFHWFNPLLLVVEHELDRWCDASCDLEICYGDGTGKNRKEYSIAIIEECGEYCELPMASMKLKRNNERDMKERIDRMKRYKVKSRTRKCAVLLMSVCFAALSAVSVLAAGQGTEAFYNVLYERTEKTIVEELEPQDELEEYVWLPDEGMQIVESDETLSARGLTTYNWELSAGMMRQTAQFHANAGSKILISITPDPMNAKTGIGLLQPNGYLRGVSGTGGYSHTFTLYEDGYYRIYARNEGSSAITVNVAVTK